MAFNDNPIVDKNAERSEDSVLEIKTFFKFSKGFLLRTESPDYGVDFDVELLDEKQSTSGNKFAIQVKSAKNIKTVIKNQNNYVTISFKTSRLGYLTRRIPGLGLITIYDDSTEKTYFDYVEDIYQRVVQNHSDDSWKELESVSIHIPIENLLTKDKIPLILSKFRTRFLNHKALLAQHGQKYDMPSLFDTHEIKNHNPLYILETYGENLINTRNINYVIQLIEKTDKAKIINSPKLCYLSALAYSHSGNVIEANYYLRRTKRFNEEFNDYQLELLQLIAPEIDLLLGDISIDEYAKINSEIYSKMKDPFNKIVSRFKFLSISASSQIVNISYEDKFDELLIEFLDELSNLNIEKSNKYALTLYTIELIQKYSIYYISAEGVKMIENAKKLIMINMNDLNAKLKKFLKFVDICNQTAEIIDAYAKNTNNSFLRADIIIIRSQIYLDANLTLFLFKCPLPYSEKVEEEYETFVRILLNAISYFTEASLHERSYRTYKVLKNIKWLYFKSYSKHLKGENIESINTILKSIEKETGIMSFDTYTDIALEKETFFVIDEIEKKHR